MFDCLTQQTTNQTAWTKKLAACAVLCCVCVWIRPRVCVRLKSSHCAARAPFPWHLSHHCGAAIFWRAAWLRRNVPCPAESAIREARQLLSFMSFFLRHHCAQGPFERVACCVVALQTNAIWGSSLAREEMLASVPVVKPLVLLA